ncbi:hypothetical protein DKX38_020435 [Salix brachista]|uniref:Uncharacterized protein n=1 Tax=Salix brachista TaxID=2182728 RepID=A0A5N5K5F3_9ROSI|nr:hypothetical protein DKX38_020435 [Salix brachista]
MNISASQYSGSGCESGWTSYLNQSTISKKQYQGFDGFVDGDCARVEDEQDEDLSMVSDASSGPPHYCEDDEFCCDKQAGKSKNKKKSREYGRGQQYSYLSVFPFFQICPPHFFALCMRFGTNLYSVRGSTLDSLNPRILKRQLQKNQVVFRLENGMTNCNDGHLVSATAVALDYGERIGKKVKEKEGKKGGNKKKSLVKRLWSLEEQSVSTFGIDERAIGSCCRQLKSRSNKNRVQHSFIWNSGSALTTAEVYRQLRLMNRNWPGNFFGRAYHALRNKHQ